MAYVPEGDTIFRAARTLNAALAGKIVRSFESVFPQLTRIDYDQPLTGRSVEGVTSAGKHMLMRFSGELTLRTHMRMNGSWHIYRPGEKWQISRSNMRITLSTDDFVAVAFSVPVAEFLDEKQLRRHDELNQLGPDLLDPAFDENAVLPRFRERRHLPISEALLNQRIMSGVGNVFKSECLFIAGVHPQTRVGVLSDEELLKLIRIARRALAANVIDGKGDGIVTYTGFRRTTGRSDPSERLWVYTRGGKPCRKCSTPIIRAKTGPDARSTYWCPSCQTEAAVPEFAPTL